MSSLKKLINNDIAIKEFFDMIQHNYVDNCHIKKYNAKSIVVKKHEPVLCCYYIVSGELKVYNEFFNGKNYIFDKIAKGQIIGEMEVLASESNYTSTVECNTNCTLIVFPKTVYEYWLNTYHNFAIECAKRIGKMIYNTAVKTGETVVYSSSHIIASILVNQYQNSDEDFVKIKDTRQVLSEKSGLSLRTVNRIIHKFNKIDYITLEKGKICISQQNYDKLKVAVL